MTPEQMKSLRAALGLSLGTEKPISQAALGQLIGYKSRDVARRNVERLESGTANTSHVAERRLTELAVLSLPASREVRVIPEWMDLMPSDEDEEAGAFYTQRMWWPRLLLAAVPEEYGEIPAEICLGQLDDYKVYLLQSDIAGDEISSLNTVWNGVVEKGFDNLRRQIEEVENL